MARALTVSPLFVTLELLVECGYCPWLLVSSPRRASGRQSSARKSTTRSNYSAAGGILTARDRRQTEPSLVTDGLLGAFGMGSGNRGTNGGGGGRLGGGGVDSDLLKNLPIAVRATE